MQLSRYSNNRDNNFNLIRFIAASLVLFSHSFPLTQGDNSNEPFKVLFGFTLGHFAVDVFFVTSGFLITASMIQRKNPIAFAWARIVRIYPALFFAILFCIFGVGLIYTNHNPIDFLTDKQTIKFFISNFSLLPPNTQYHLPGVFENSIHSNAINGSLWTLPWEIRMYFLLAVISFSFWNKKEIIIPTLAVTSTIIYLANSQLNLYEHGKLNHLVRFTSLYFIGASFFILQEKIILSHRIAFSLFAISTLAYFIFPKESFIIPYTIVISYFIFYLAYIPGGFIRQYNKLGDYSYGMYVYAFPIQQCLFISSSGSTPLSNTTSSFILTLLLAIASWHFIEKRSLSLKNKYQWIEKFFRMQRKN